MCGLIGFIGHGKPAHLDRGAEEIKRRGPDGLGSWTSDDGHVHVKHALLAISAEAPHGQQPMLDPETGLVLAFNGELYNHRDLRPSLKRQCTTPSDTETLLKLIGEQGVGAIARLRGMFAVVLVDTRAHTVHLVRDPIGKKPLFVLKRPEGTYFSSSVMGLAVASGHTAIDEDAARRWWDLGHTPPETSLLAGCFPLKPGEAVELDWNGDIASRQRIAPPDPTPVARMSFADAVAELDHHMRTAVRRRLADNPSPVALLSGGIDSTLVCKYALEAGNVRLVTCQPRLFPTADRAFALEAAKRLNTPLDILPLPLSNVSSAVARAVDLQDEPLAMISFVPLAMMSKQAATRSRIMLTGDGGDEAFCGYGHPTKWISERQAAHSITTFRSGPSLPAWMSPYAHLATGHDLVGHGLAKLDRATAEQALEARSPLLDWDVLAFVRSLPRETVLPGDTAKPLAKALLTGWPMSFLERTKAGFPFRLRALWALSCYSGLRERIDRAAVEMFRAGLPERLQTDAVNWSSLDIASAFDLVYKLYVWSTFLARLRSASAVPATGHDASCPAGATTSA